MKESLESIRNIHQILIVVCTVVAIFALSLTTERNKYDDALVELDTLERVCVNVANQRVRVIAEHFVRDAKINSVSEYPVADSTITNIFLNQKVEDIQHYIKSNRRDMDSLYIYDFVWDPFILADDSTLSFLYLNFQRFPINAEPIPYGGHAVGVRRIYDERGSYFFNFMRSGLLDTTLNLNSFLPHLRLIWKEVKNYKIQECKEYLKLRSQEFAMESQRDVDVSGLKVAGRYMHLVGPFLILTLEIYMLVLITHISHIFNDDERKVLINFPWLGLFPDRLSNIILVTTIFVFPSAASGAIVWRSNLSGGFTVWLLLFYLIVLALIAVILYFKVFKLQNKVHFPETQYPIVLIKLPSEGIIFEIREAYREIIALDRDVIYENEQVSLEERVYLFFKKIFKLLFNRI